VGAAVAADAGSGSAVWPTTRPAAVTDSGSRENRSSTAWSGVSGWPDEASVVRGTDSVPAAQYWRSISSQPTSPSSNGSLVCQVSNEATGSTP
jgi:hypothetical protein